ncbi:MAG: 50S ribosomal protein L28 [Candidatus Saccharimonadales bacterium]
MQKCEVTGKGKQFGHNVSFSLRKTSKVWKPNLQTKTVIVDGKKVKMKLSTSAIRTLKKKNLLNPEAQKPTQKAIN